MQIDRSRLTIVEHPFDAQYPNARRFHVMLAGQAFPYAVARTEPAAKAFITIAHNGGCNFKKR